MRRSFQIPALVLGVLPLIFILVSGRFEWTLTGQIGLIFRYLPIGLSLLFIALALGIRRVIDMLPAAAFAVYYLITHCLNISVYTPNPLFEVTFPVIVILTQTVVLFRHRSWLEITCISATGAAAFFWLATALIPTISNRIEQALVTNLAIIDTPWAASDMSVALFLAAALVLLLIPTGNARNLRFEHVMALVPVFLCFEFGVRGDGGAAAAVCATSFYLILLSGAGRMYLLNAFVDELTGLQNRRAFDERLKRLRGGYSIAIIDIDHFKGFNDTYGHTEGDNALRWTAGHIHDVSGRRAFRYGGEEFCVVFPRRGSHLAPVEMESLRSTIERSDFTIRKKRRENRALAAKKKRGSVSTHRNVQVTVSIGVASRNGERKKTDQVLKAADQALYTAKAEGRNRVVSADG